MKPAVERSDLLVNRVFSRLLIDDRAHEAVERQGYAVVGPVIDASAVAVLAQLHTALLPRIDGRSSERWYTTGAMQDPRSRREVYDAIGSVLRPALSAHVEPGVEVLARNFHVNPANSIAGLGPHQDVALVDEAVSSTVNGWIPLQDVSSSNAPLQVVPGSHRFGNADRSLAVPWAYQGLHDLFWEHAVPLSVPAGHMVVFDTALVHCSGANTSGDDRVAANCILLPAEAKLRHLVAGDLPGQVDVYEVTADFLVQEDLSSVPRPEHGVFLERRPVRDTDITPEGIRAKCRAGAELDVAVVPVPGYQSEGGLEGRGRACYLSSKLGGGPRGENRLPPAEGATP